MTALVTMPPAVAVSPTTATWSTLPVTGTLLPSTSCGAGMQTPPEGNAVGVYPLTNQTFQIMESCCNGARIVAYQGGCSAYCSAQSQSLEQLYTCFDQPDGILKDGIIGITCEGDCQPLISMGETATGTQTGTPIASGPQTTSASATSATGVAATLSPHRNIKLGLAVIAIVITVLETGMAVYA